MVSLPCSRSAERTCARSVHKAAAGPPYRGYLAGQYREAQIDASGVAFAAGSMADADRTSRQALGQQVGSGKAARRHMEAHGRLVIVSHSRHETFSRTIRITLHCRGINSSVSVMSSLVRSAAGTAPPRRSRARATVLGEWLAAGRLGPLQSPPQLKHCRKPSASSHAARSVRIITCAAASSVGSDRGSHGSNVITPIPCANKKRWPTDAGRHVPFWCLQSLPDSR